MKRVRNRATFGLVVLGSLLPLIFAGGVVAASPPTVGLGTADSFAVLAGSSVTDVPNSAITGDVGVSPSGWVPGLTCAEVTGTIYSVDASGPAPCRVTNPGLLTTAQNDLTAAFTDAAGRLPDTTFAATDNQLGGQVLVAGVYRFGHGTTANLIGNLTLNGDASSVWIFQATSDLVAQSSSTVTLTGGAQACNVFWQVGTSATIGTSARFVGTVMADQTIALQTGASLQGRALARIAAVTLDQNTITRSTCAASLPPEAPADVGVVKTASPGTVSIGDQVTYTSVVTNHGPGVATSVAFGDTLPASETFVSVTTTQGSCTGTTTIACAIGTLDLGAFSTVVIVVRMTAAGTITNTAQIGARQADQNVGDNNTSAAVVDVAALVPAPTETAAARAAAARAAAARAAAARAAAARAAAARAAAARARAAAARAAAVRAAAVRRAATPAGAGSTVSTPALPPVTARGFTG